LKILVIAPRIPYPLIDGYSRAVFHPLQFMASRGHVVILCFLAEEPDQKAMTDLQKHFTVVSYPSSTERTFGGMMRSLFSRESYYLNRFHNPGFLKTIMELIERERPDIIQLEQLHCAYYGQAIRKQYAIPVMLRLHNIESVLVDRFGKEARNPLAKIYSAIETRKIRRYEKSIASSCDRIITISLDDAWKLEEITLGSRSLTIPSGVDTDFFSPAQSKTDTDSILLLAAFHWKPNEDSFWWFVNEILPTVLSKKPNARLLVLGTNPSEEMLSYRHPNVEVIGPVEDVREYIARSSVSVVPLRVGGGIRLKLLELFAMEAAVVSTTVGCEGLRVDKDLHLKVEDSATRFADAVVALLENGSERLAIGRAARRLVLERFAWDVLLPGYESLCKEVASTIGVRKK
jgi:glycosyltransferase involved in cell wall biosynthesis